jgi:hypothetical protein
MLPPSSVNFSPEGEDRKFFENQKITQHNRPEHYNHYFTTFRPTPTTNGLLIIMCKYISIYFSSVSLSGTVSTYKLSPCIHTLGLSF